MGGFCDMEMDSSNKEFVMVVNLRQRVCLMVIKKVNTIKSIYYERMKTWCVEFCVCWTTRSSAYNSTWRIFR